MRASPEELQLQVQRLEAEKRLAELKNENSASTPKPAALSNTGLSAEDRLNSVKALLDKGLISEAKYQEKRNLILQEFYRVPDSRRPLPDQKMNHLSL